MNRKQTPAALFVLIIIMVIIVPISGTRVEPSLPGVLSRQLASDETCIQILTRAMQSLQSTCNDVSRNNACYGNNQVKAEPNAGKALKFDAAGDRAPIRNIRTLVTSPLDVEAGSWGLSILKLQANLPDTQAGINVTSLVFGNTSIENASGDMEAYYFSTGVGSPSCKEVPKDAIIVRSPPHAEVTFTANGVRFLIASTVVLRAERNKSMTVELVDGRARLTTPGGSQVLNPGQVSTVTLGGANGLTATDAPSVPASATSDAALAPVFITFGKIVDPDAPVNIAINGCISSVTGKFVTINDYQVDVRNNNTLKNAKVGDCVHVYGTLSLDTDNNAILTAVGRQPRTPVVTRKREGTTISGSGIHNGGRGDGSGSGVGVPVPVAMTMTMMATTTINY